MRIYTRSNPRNTPASPRLMCGKCFKFDAISISIWSANAKIKVNLCGVPQPPLPSGSIFGGGAPTLIYMSMMFSRLPAREEKNATRHKACLPVTTPMPLQPAITIVPTQRPHFNESWHRSGYASALCYAELRFFLPFPKLAVAECLRTH